MASKSISWSEEGLKLPSSLAPPEKEKKERPPPVKEDEVEEE